MMQTTSVRARCAKVRCSTNCKARCARRPTTNSHESGVIHEGALIYKDGSGTIARLAPSTLSELCGDMHPRRHAREPGESIYVGLLSECGGRSPCGRQPDRSAGSPKT